MLQCVKRVWVLLPGQRSSLISSPPCFRAQSLTFEPWLFLVNASRLFASSNPACLFQRFSILEKVPNSDPRDALTEVEMLIYAFGFSSVPIVGCSVGIWYKWSICSQGKAEELWSQGRY